MSEINNINLFFDDSDSDIEWELDDNIPPDDAILFDWYANKIVEYQIRADLDKELARKDFTYHYQRKKQKAKVFREHRNLALRVGGVVRPLKTRN
jgi:hypothetical protein